MRFFVYMYEALSFLHNIVAFGSLLSDDAWLRDVGGEGVGIQWTPLPRGGDEGNRERTGGKNIRIEMFFDELFLILSFLPFSHSFHYHFPHLFPSPLPSHSLLLFLSQDVSYYAATWVQYLDAVWQLTRAYPKAFQFNESFLVFLVRFGGGWNLMIFFLIFF